MRITKVLVKKLFGIFDHEIPLNQDSRITIIHGPNGFGKTILLTMLNGLFNSNYRVFREVPFREFRVYLDYHEYLVVSKENDELKLSLINVTGVYTLNLIADEADPGWLSQIRRSINVELIKTQRLQTEVAIEADSTSINRSARARIRGLAVEEFSAKAATLVHDALGESELSTSQLKQITEIIDDLERLLRRKKATDDPNTLEIDEKLEYVQSMIDTVNRRTANVEETGRRLTTLVDLLNGHFSFKTLYTDTRRGLVILGQDGNLIPVSKLSSGEQHQLVLFSKLLFDMPPNSLVLIDEPELSLHVTWQHEFLADLKRIIELRDFDVLIATHSPHIVHDKLEWMVDLHNPEADYSDDVAEYA